MTGNRGAGDVMRPKWPTAVLLVASVLIATSLSAQGIGGVAARERSKRAEQAQGKKAEPRVFTNDDLPAGQPPGPEADDRTVSPPAETPGDQGAPPEASPGEERGQQERGYLEEVEAAQARVGSLQDRIRALSDKLNPTNTSYIYGSSGSHDANEELRVRAELTQAEADLRAASQAVETASRRLQDFRRGRSGGSGEN